MIEIISITRLIVDYLWQYKELSVIHSACTLTISIGIAFYFKRRAFQVIKSDLIALAFIFCAIISFSKSVTSAATIELFKLSTYFAFYFCGRFIPASKKHTNYLGVFSILSLLWLTGVALSDNGYVTWGNVRTFTGGYFFKTDLAIATLIALTLSFSTLQNRILLAVSLACAGYLVFKSNARIALPLVVLIPCFISMSMSGRLRTIKLKDAVIVLITTISSIALFSIINFSKLGMLGFDFSDPFSSSNTQGRSVIWSAILHAYSNSSLINQLFGSGLSADVEATLVFSESVYLEGVRAHNSYLYLLICMGVMGSLIFYCLIYSILQKAFFLLRQDDARLRVVPTISCAFIIMFFWLSMTTEIIIRPQLMILLFFFSGLHVQNYLKVKKAMRANLREPTYSS